MEPGHDQNGDTSGPCDRWWCPGCASDQTSAQKVGTMYLGEDLDPGFATVPAETPATPIVDPWYARPVESVLTLLGNITYKTNDYTIRSSDGTLIVDRSTSTPATVTPAAAQTGTIMQSFARVPAVIWIGVGSLLLFSAMGRK